MLGRRLAEAEAELQSNPTDYMARMKRLYAMAGREMTRRREELRARHPELCDSAHWRMAEPDETKRPTRGSTNTSADRSGSDARQKRTSRGQLAPLVREEVGEITVNRSTSRRTRCSR